ncbi:MAG: serine hydrolase domain-containing protein [Protaetiibacter sp.]
MSGRAEGIFTPVADVFARTMAYQAAGGAALAVYHRGEKVIDLIGGDYVDDSVQYLYSVTKAITAIAAAKAQEQGLIDLDQPLASFWPAFQRRTELRGITTRWVLAHRTGLASITPRMTLEELLANRDEELIEAQDPFWEPGTTHGYHGYTYGTLMNSVFKRTVGINVGGYVARELAGPLGLDLWIGTPESEQHRAVPVVRQQQWITPLRAAHVAAVRIPATGPSTLGDPTVYNRPEVLAADWPAINGVASARALAALMEASLHGGILTSESRDTMIRTRARGKDFVLGVTTQFGSGMQLPFPQLPFLGPRSYGHEAAGGTVAFADPDFGIAVGYTTNVFPQLMGANAGFLVLLGALRHVLTADDSPIEGGE